MGSFRTVVLAALAAGTPFTGPTHPGAIAVGRATLRPTAPQTRASRSTLRRRRTLYLDGALESANDLTKTSASLDAHTYAATIGTKPGGGALDGVIDEVAIYDYALSQSLITEHHMLGSKL